MLYFKRTLLGLVLLIVISLAVWRSVDAQIAPTPIKSAAVSDCFPGTGETGSPPGPASYPPRVYLPVVVVENTCTTNEIEPNGDHTQAQTLTTSCVAGKINPETDVDWYRFHFCSPVATATIQLQGEAAMDLYLYSNPAGAPIGSAEHLGLSEAITATNLLSGTYYMRVSPVVASDTGADNYSVAVEAQ